MFVVLEQLAQLRSGSVCGRVVSWPLLLPWTLEAAQTFTPGHLGTVTEMVPDTLVAAKIPFLCLLRQYLLNRYFFLIVFKITEVIQLIVKIF